MCGLILVLGVAERGNRGAHTSSAPNISLFSQRISQQPQHRVLKAGYITSLVHTKISPKWHSNAYINTIFHLSIYPLVITQKKSQNRLPKPRNLPEPEQLPRNARPTSLIPLILYLPSLTVMPWTRSSLSPQRCWRINGTSYIKSLRSIHTWSHLWQWQTLNSTLLSHIKSI